ncbi:GAF domain-containing protein [Nocardia sp. CA-128927]|uniref:GAF domain-containing protein n=1 Tax=Nocardia sp. CA-128927 TaxID=3239975 RepID=UPI003D97424C
MTTNPHPDPNPTNHLPSRAVRTTPSPKTREDQRAATAEHCPSPARLPRRRPATPSQDTATPEPQSQLLSWVLAETLGDNGEAVVVAEGEKLKSLGRLDRTRIAQSRRASTAMPALVHQCLLTQKRQYRDIPGTHALTIHVVPAVGPSGAVHAVQLWTGAPTQKPPLRTPVGTVEWDTTTGVAELNTALERQLGIPTQLSRPQYTLPDLLSHIDGFDDFLGFLDLFDRASTADRWIGTVTTPGRFSMIRRHLRIVARVHIEPGKRRVRAIVHDITTLQPPPPPHVDSVTLAGYPGPTTHAIARVDLGTCLINRWICLGPGPLEPWSHQNPQIDNDSAAAIARCCAELHRGATGATAELKVRFTPSRPWIPVHTEWTALVGARRPQAIVVLTPHEPSP